MKIEVGKMRVLLVDDFDVVKLILRNALKKLGISDITQASDGLEAAKLIAEACNSKRPFHMILCDWNLPEKNGLEVLAEARKFPDFDKVAFVMVTAESDQKQMGIAIAKGAADYITKPIGPDELEIKLKQIVGKIQSRAA